MPSFRPAHPMPIVLPIQRAWIEQGNVDHVVDLLSPLHKSPERIVQMAGSLNVFFPGYENDPREIWTIPEIRVWFAALTEKFPWWLVFLDRTTDAFPLALSLLIKGQEVRAPEHDGPGWDMDGRDVERVLKMLFSQMKSLFEQNRIAPKERQRISAEAEEAINVFLE